MIVDIKIDPNKFYMVRFDVPNLHLLCQVFGWFNNLMEMDEFFESIPIIKIEENVDFDQITIQIYDEEKIIAELIALMCRLDFDIILSQLNKNRHTYIFRHTRRKVI